MYKIALIVALLQLPLVAQQRNVGALTTWYTKVLPLVIIGEGWSQKLIIQNVDTTPAIGTVQFYTKEGQPWTVELLTGTNSAFLFNLTPGQTAIFETRVKQDLQVLGWALISQTSGGLGDTITQTVFRKQSPGRADLMTSMVAGDQGFDSFSVHFDNTNQNYTGLGILISNTCAFSSCQNDEPYTVTVADLNGTVISRKTIQQKRGRLYWMNLGSDFPETNGRAGTFTVEAGASSGYLTGFSLQFAGNGAFTAITPFEN